MARTLQQPPRKLPALRTAASEQIGGSNAPPTREPASASRAEPPHEPNLRARFVPLAESRTSSVIAALDYLGQLSHRARYRYTEEEVDAIEAAIFEKLTETIDAFRRGMGNKPGFKFRSVAGPQGEGEAR